MIQDLETLLYDFGLENDGSLHLLLTCMENELRAVLKQKSAEKLDLSHREGQAFKRTRTNRLQNKRPVACLGLNDAPRRLPVDRLIVTSAVDQYATISLHNYQPLTLPQMTPCPTRVLDSTRSNHNQQLPSLKTDDQFPASLLKAWRD